MTSASYGSCNFADGVATITKAPIASSVAVYVAFKADIILPAHTKCSVVYSYAQHLEVIYNNSNTIGGPLVASLLYYYGDSESGGSDKSASETFPCSTTASGNTPTGGSNFVHILESRPVGVYDYSDDLDTITYINSTNGAKTCTAYFGFYVVGQYSGDSTYSGCTSTLTMSENVTVESVNVKTDKLSDIYMSGGNNFNFYYNKDEIDLARVNFTDTEGASKQIYGGTGESPINTAGLCTLKAAGTYVFDFDIKYNAVWEDTGNKSTKSIILTIEKGTPNVAFSFEDETLNSKAELYLKDYAAMPPIKNGHANPTAGTIAWDSGQTPSKAKSEYSWTFTPTDTLNYESVSGTKTIDFVDAVAKGIHVYVKDGAEIYDRYDTATYSSLGDYLKTCLTVKVFYEDGSESTSPLAGSNYNVTTTDISVTAGDSQSKTISVRVTSTDTSINGLTGSVSATVKKAVIQSMSVEQKADATNLVYPVTLDDIKNNYDVYLGWNFSARELKTDASKITVALADGEELKAGTVNFIFTFTDGDLTKTSNPVEVTINKGTYPDADKITFDNKTVSFGGQHSIAVENLPEGVTVKYVYNGEEFDEPPVFEALNEEGYEITAKFTHTNPNYEDIADITAKLIITDKEIYDKSELTVKGDGLTVEDNKISATYSGEAFVFAPDGKVKDNNGVEVTPTKTEVVYKLDNEVVTEIKNAGTYTVTVTYTMPTDGDYADYEPSFEVKYTFTVNKADFDIKSIISFNDKTVEYDGEVHSIVIDGELPDWITVTYLGNGGSDIGIYLATAFFSHDNPNYNAIGNMTATLTIKEGAPVIPPEEGGDDGSSNNMFLYIGIGVGALLLLGLLLFLLLRRKRADGYDDDYDDEYDYDDDDDDEDDEDDEDYEDYEE